MEKNEIRQLSSYITEGRYEKILSALNCRTRYLTVVMENFYDPRNASAVLRSCDAFGLQDAHVIELDNRHFISRRVCRGSQFWVNRYAYPSSEESVAHLKNQGYRVVFADPRPEYPALEDLPLDQKTAVVFGQEKRGITPEMKELSDGGFRIPNYGFVESFNVSVACALTLSHLITRLRKDPPANFFLSEEEKEKLLDHWLAKNTLIGNVLKKSGRLEEFLLNEPYLMRQ